jgi:transcriptional regulator
VVHAHGRAEMLDDNALVGVLEDLSRTQEGRLDKTPWTAQKMDQHLYAKMRGAIVGFQMPIERLEGKFKMSQNRPDTARNGVITALDSLDSDSAHKTAGTMRALMQNGKAEPKP